MSLSGLIFSRLKCDYLRSATVDLAFYRYIVWLQDLFGHAPQQNLSKPSSRESGISSAADRQPLRLSRVQIRSSHICMHAQQFRSFATFRRQYMDYLLLMMTMTVSRMTRASDAVRQQNDSVFLG